ncbi:MAG: 8-oxo-dGTP diphosphatase [bacterium]|nr:8-oxo-dGTP diphosphatase [bacterium]
MSTTSKKILTLCLVHNGDQVLLGMKKRGFGAGRWNGFGGKVEVGETIEEAALRELHEEAGIHGSNLEKRGTLLFIFENDPVALEVHIFRIDAFSGEPIETEEMAPQWYHEHAIPLENMWPDDAHWYPLYLEGKNFTGSFTFSDSNTISHHELFVID